MKRPAFNRLSILTIALYAFCQIPAQTAIWEMAPTEYTSVNKITNGLYKAETHNDINIIKPDGTPILDISCSEITPFYENKALIIKHENSEERILGAISIDGDYTLFSRRYYGLQGQLFYSDGLLSVKDENGRKGYIDAKGNEQIGFNGLYDVIKPFSEGYATVYRNKKYMLIDKSGRAESIYIGIGEVNNGTNVYNGKAFIFDKANNKWYQWDVINKKSEACKKPQDVQQLDYLFCFASISNRGKTPTYQSVPSGKISISPSTLQGLYGFNKDNKVFIPYQFSEATPFENGHAVVKLGHKYGILKLIDTSESFAIEIANDTLKYLSGRNVECSFSINAPKAWQAGHLDIILKDSATGERIAVTKNEDLYTFTCKPLTDKHTYTIEAVSNGLLLASKNINYTFIKQRQNLNFTISITDDEADNNGKVWVKVVVSNPNEETIQTTLSLSGGNAKFAEKKETVTIPGEKSIELKSYFYDVTHKFTNQYIKVNTTNAGSAIKRNITFKAAAPPIL